MNDNYSNSDRDFRPDVWRGSKGKSENTMIEQIYELDPLNKLTAQQLFIRVRNRNEAF